MIVIGLVLFLVASNTQTGWVYLLSGTVFGALMTGWWSSRRALRPANFRLWVPGSVPRGQGFAATLSWTSAALGYSAYWKPLGQIQLDQQGREQALLESSQREQKVWLIGQQRGIFSQIPGEITCYGPLAWFAARRRLNPELSQPLYILPRRREMSNQKMKALARGSLGDRRGQPAGQGDLRRLREYQVGDDVRWIHWASSARRGELVVREFSQGGALQLVLCWGCQAEALSEVEAFEELMDWVYTYFVSAREQGWPVQLLVPQADGSWKASEQIEILATAQAQVTPPAPAWSAAQGWARIDFWLGRGCSPAGVEVLEFGEKARV
ncbi:DUF58 domain-containing protein [bacterium]|nr:DUF58 domain-containing protein [bacterium]